MANRMNYASCSEEEKRFEESMRIEMENPGGKCTDTARNEHHTEMAQGRIRNDPLDIVLYTCDRGRKDRGNASHNRHDVHCYGRKPEDGIASGNQKDTGGNHGSSVNESTDRCRTFHCIRQPHMKRHLR